MAAMKRCNGYRARFDWHSHSTRRPAPFGPLAFASSPRRRNRFESIAALREPNHTATTALQQNVNSRNHLSQLRGKKFGQLLIQFRYRRIKIIGFDRDQDFAAGGRHLPAFTIPRRNADTAGDPVGLNDPE